MSYLFWEWKAVGSSYNIFVCDKAQTMEWLLLLFFFFFFLFALLSCSEQSLFLFELFFRTSSINSFNLQLTIFSLKAWNPLLVWTEIREYFSTFFSPFQDYKSRPGRRPTPEIYDGGGIYGPEDGGSGGGGGPSGGGGGYPTFGRWGKFWFPSFYSWFCYLRRSRHIRERKVLFLLLDLEKLF